MIRDPFYREIIGRLKGRLDADAFEACASDLLRREFPSLVPVPGGTDDGMDGVTAEPGPFLVSTTSADVIGNLTRNLTSYLKTGRCRRAVVLATSQELTKKKRDNLEERARELGFTLVHIYSQAAIADRLYYEPRWCKELLGLTGRPSALSVIPSSNRPLLDCTLIGREADLAWLRECRGDRLLFGAPGSGKTFLLRSLASEGLALFLVDGDKGAIADAIRSQHPSAIVVDDAHFNVDSLSMLRQLRKEIGAEFEIIATSWAGDKDQVAEVLNLGPPQIRELDLLTRDEIVEVIKSASLIGPVELIREIVNQSEGRPGLAVTLTVLCRRGGVRDVVFGEALSRSLIAAFERLVGRPAKDVLGAFSLGGDAGLDLEVVAEFFRISMLELRSTLARLAAGGVVREAANGRLSVWPRTLRYILIKDTFFTPPVLDVRKLISNVPDKSGTASTLVGARARGADIPWLSDFLQQVDSQQAWRDFASLGEDEATFVLEYDPTLITVIGRVALEVAPAVAVPLLLSTSVGDNSSLNSSVDHALGIIQGWVLSALPGTGMALDRRRTLLRTTTKWLQEGGDERTAVRAVVIAASPKFEQTSSDPGRGLTLTISRGFLTHSEIEGVGSIWKSISKLVQTIGSADWVALFSAIHDWAYPYSGSSVIQDETALYMRSIIAEIFKEFSETTRQRPGIQQRLREYAQNLQIDLLTSHEREFEILFPTEDLENWEETDQTHTREVTALAADWHDRSPKLVAARLVHLESEAAIVQKTFPRLTWLLCKGLAERADSCVNWVNEFIDQDLPGDTVFQFLQRAVLTEEKGWQEVSLRCLNSPKYTGVGVSVLLTVSNLPESLLTLMDAKIAPFDSLVRSLTLRGEIPDETVHHLLQSTSTRIVTAVVLGEWSRGSPGFRESLAAQCRKAVLRVEGEDQSLRQIFGRDSSLAHDWLVARISADAGTLSYHSFKTVQRALEVLSFDQKLSVLDRLSIEPESADWQWVQELTASDPLLFQVVLGRKHMGRFHLVALELSHDGDTPGSPTNNWCEMALMALDAGYSPEDVAKAAVPWSWNWNGDDPLMCSKWVDNFESVLRHQDSRLHAVANVGIQLARERAQYAGAGNRRAQVYGLTE